MHLNQSVSYSPFLLFALTISLHHLSYADFDSLNKWQPTLSAPIAFYEPISRNIGDEVLNAYPEYALRKLYEAELYMAFQRHLRTLSNKEKKLANQQQLDWLNTVYAEYKEEGDYFKYGRLGEITAEKILIERIQERIRKLGE